MRLTLRTLLAYMDDILDPADQEQLGRKIESSAFATELIHRSRDAVRRLRLSAPEVLAGDSGEVLDGDANLDANTAAEYLDNTLSPDEVAEFERSCLEAGPHADMLLAEAASCHHVLTMVLGEPAEVDANLRQRMYALLEQQAGQQLRIEPAHSAPAAQAVGAGIVAVEPSAPHRADVERAEAEAPDYMLAAARASRRTRRLAAAALMAMLIGGGATWLFWPQGEVEAPAEVANAGDVENPDALVIGPGEPAGAAATTGDAVGEAGDAAPAWSVGEATEATEAPAFGDASAGAPVAATAPTLPPLSDANAEADVPPKDVTPVTDGPAPPAIVSVETEATLADGVAAIEPPVGDAPEAPPTDIPTDDATIADDAADVPLTASIPVPPIAVPALDALPATDAVADAGGAAETDADVVPGLPSEPSPDSIAAAALSDEAAAPRQLGAYLGNNDVLLRFDPKSESWIRLPPRTALATGDRLLSLPTFRTHVVLGDANAYLSGGTEVGLLPPGAASGDAPADLNLHIPFGQLILNAGLNGNSLELDLGGELRVLHLEPSSSLAIEVRRPFERGNTPKREPAPPEIVWYLTSGKAQWGVGGETEEAVAPAMWTTAAGEDGPPQTIEKLPAWVDSEPIIPSERRARDEVAKSLAAGEAVNIPLLELSDPAGRGRRAEDRVLVAKSSAYVGEFDPLVKALADVNQRTAWSGLIESLRQAIARDPASIEAIRASFSQRGDDEANDLMEMLLGFDRESIGVTPQQIKEGSLVRLVRWLDHDDLTMRILASYNINEILGTKESFGYKPEQTETQRRIAIKRIGDRLDSGELKPK